MLPRHLQVEGEEEFNDGQLDYAESPESPGGMGGSGEPIPEAQTVLTLQDLYHPVTVRNGRRDLSGLDESVKGLARRFTTTRKGNGYRWASSMHAYYYSNKTQHYGLSFYIPTDHSRLMVWVESGSDAEAAGIKQGSRVGSVYDNAYEILTQIDDYREQLKLGYVHVG